MDILPVILSGGSGSRLWPVSRKQYPKHLLNLIDDDSLFQKTLQRVDRLRGTLTQKVHPPLVVCNEAHRFLIAEQAQVTGIKLESIILEPMARNTAPALALAVGYAAEKFQDVLLLVLPSDHVISDRTEFSRSVQRAADNSISENSVTIFGIPPTSPHTGYGYIKASQSAGVFSVERFTEKPDLETATKYLSEDGYFWNAGMFVLPASVGSMLLNQFAAEVAEVGAEAIANAKSDLDFLRVAEEDFAKSPADSIDYAIMEPLSLSDEHELYCVPMTAGWSDLGSWASISDYQEKDQNDNALTGDVLTHDSRNNIAYSRERLICLVGVDNLAVIDTKDALLVMDKARSEEVKHIVDQLSSSGRHESLIHKRVYRPWGSYEGVDEGERFQVKRIEVKPGEVLSLQKHHHRAEHWIIVKGTAEVTNGEKVFLLSENESTYIPIGAVHRLKNPGSIPLELVEVQSGSYLGEDDIVRLDDVYGRGKQDKI